MADEISVCVSVCVVQRQVLHRNVIMMKRYASQSLLLYMAHTHTHTRTHTHTHTHTPSCVQAHVQVNTNTHAVDTHLCTQDECRNCMYTQMQTHTHTHTHTRCMLDLSQWI